MNHITAANMKPLNTSKFMFATKDAAEKAKLHLSQEYPLVRMAVSECGSLFCHTNGSLLYDMEITSKVSKLGGCLVYGST